MAASGMMERALLVGPEQIKFEEIAIPTPARNQVLIKVHSCALCTWEQRTYTGAESFYPLAGGHEVSGVVVEKGDQVYGLELGDHVTLSGLYRCGQCESCRRGYDNVCENGTKLRDPNSPGGLGQYVLRLGTDCFKVSKDIPLEHAALSEPLACVLRSVKRANLRAGERVVIIGAGIMGMFHLLLAKNAGTTIIVSEPDEKRRQKALEMGAHFAFSPLEKDYVQTVRALTGGTGADVTFICVAHTATIEPAVIAAAIDGRVLCYSSFFPKGQKIQIDPNIFHKKEVTLTGTMSQRQEDFLEAAALISSRAIDLEPLISATYPLRELHQAFKAAIDPSTFRVLVQP